MCWYVAHSVDRKLALTVNTAQQCSTNTVARVLWPQSPLGKPNCFWLAHLVEHLSAQHHISEWYQHTSTDNLSMGCVYMGGPM